MRTIKESTIVDAWKTARKTVKEFGHRIYDDEEELLELINLFVIVTDPIDEKLDTDIENSDMYRWMADNFTNIKKVPELGNSWSYGWRLYKYMDEVNQIKYIVNKLKKKPESKSATITTLIKPGIESYVPCVSLLDFKLRDGVLTLTTTCRSIDIGKKGLYNMIELTKIVNGVALLLDVRNTRLIMHIISAHIYKRDLEGD